MQVQRAESLRRAAQARAFIIALIVKAGSEGISSKNVWLSLTKEMKELGYTQNNLSNFLHTMSANKLIVKTGPLGQIRYFPAGTVIGLDSAPSSNQKKQKASKKEGKISDIPSLTIDVIKSTGRVRISLKGLVIEIDVVD